MAERAQATAATRDAATRAYIRDAATSSSADELAKLADLRAQGAITDDEFQSLKAKIVS
jgi:hypothetical protein